MSKTEIGVTVKARVKKFITGFIAGVAVSKAGTWVPVLVQGGISAAQWIQTYLLPMLS